MQVNDYFVEIIIYIKDEWIIIEIKRILTLVIIISKQILIQLKNRIYNERECKISRQTKIKIHNCRPMNLK